MMCYVVDNRSLDKACAFASLWASRDWPGIELCRQRFDAQVGQWLDMGAVPLVG
jgi:hypothetical protein